MKLQNYTLRYLAITLLAVIPIWAGLFYMLILDEVYDNIDDDLKNSKIIIIRQAFADEKLLNTPEFGINKFTIKPLPKGNYSYKDEFSSSSEFMEYDDDDEPIRTLTTVFNDKEGNPHELVIKASIVEEDELLEDLAVALLGLYVMLVISILVVNHFLLKESGNRFMRFWTTLKNSDWEPECSQNPSILQLMNLRHLPKKWKKCCNATKSSIPARNNLLRMLPTNCRLH